jgi:transcriptional regulator with XRE-family HTH domain
MNEDAAGRRLEHEAVGARLREAREVLGLTQEDVAEALAIPRTSVIAMEAGRRKVSGLELRRLGRLYRRPVDWLLGETTAGVGADEALHRATADLSPADKEQVLRFAQFLAAAGPAGRSAPVAAADGQRAGEEDADPATGGRT